MINHSTLARVQMEVTRFQAALDAVREAERKRREAEGIAYARAIINDKNAIEPWVMAYSGSPETAALRRASMDLTRALADLRRST